MNSDLVSSQPGRPAKVALLTNLTATVSLPVLKSLANATDVQLCHVLFYDTVSKAKGSLRKFLREQGLKPTIIKASHWLVRTARSWFREKLGWQSGTCQYCHEYAVANDLPYSVFADMNEPAITELLKSLEVDILLVCSCSQILKKPVLSAPQIASINVHPSLLPKYRGPTPIFWALYYGELQTGVTFHLMTEAIDDGDVISQIRISIDSKWGEQELSDRLFDAAGAQVVTVVHDFVRGQIKPQPQTRDHAIYKSHPTAQQRQQLLARTR